MEIGKFIEDLGISTSDNPISKSDDKWEIVFDSSDDYAQLYSLLTKSDLVDLVTDDSIFSESKSVAKFLGDDYDVTLEADFNNDTYTFTVEETKE